MSYSDSPKWFVQTEDKNLWAYFTLGVLLCDLALNKHSGPIQILEKRGGFILRYQPVSIESLKKAGAA